MTACDVKDSPSELERGRAMVVVGGGVGGVGGWIERGIKGKEGGEADREAAVCEKSSSTCVSVCLCHCTIKVDLK